MSKNSKIILSGLLLIVIALIITLILILSNKNTSRNFNNSANISQIRTNWETFFGAKTPISEREHLLQNGSQFDSEIKSEFSSLGTSSFGVSINNIAVNSSTQAKVNYNVMLQGQEVLKDQNGQAVLLNNTWKVSDSTLCSLLAMAGNNPKICQTH